jgi:citrate synthase
VPKKSVQLSGVVVAESAICSIDPDEGVLRYRGYDIAELAEHSSYEETALLLLVGDAPSAARLDAFKGELAQQRELPVETAEAIDRQAGTAAPMEVLRTAVSTLSAATPTQLIAQLPTMVARYGRRREGLEPVEPDPSLSYSENFLAMLHGERSSERDAHAFDVSMMLHAEHEMNASTFAARVVAGTGADLTAAVVAAIGALSGPLHGGANEAAMVLFERIGSPDRAPDEVHSAFERKEKLFGFGHPLYRAYDPRAVILKRLSRDLSEGAGEPNWYAITEATERTVVEEKGLYPNVDLYSGSVYRYLGIPTDLFTPLFAASRVAGWSAHVLEQQADNKIIRPSAEYIGEPGREFPP